MAPACIFVSSRTLSRSTIRTMAICTLQMFCNIWGPSCMFIINPCATPYTFSGDSCCLLVRRVQTLSIIWALKILTLLVSVKYRFMFSPLHCTAGFPLSEGCNCFPVRANHCQQPTNTPPEVLAFCCACLFA